MHLYSREVTLDIWSIKTFLTLADVKRLSVCAELLCITKSAASSRIKQLEGELDQKLFERSARGMQMTPAGERFYQHAQIMQQHWQHAKAEMKLSESSGCSLNIATHPTLAVGFLHRWGYQLKQLNEQLTLHMSVDYSREIIAQVASGSLDIGLIFVADVTTGLIVEQVFEEPLIMVSTRPCRVLDVTPEEYLYIDWGWGYNAAHIERLPHLKNCSQTCGYGGVGLSWLLSQGGSTYLPTRIAADAIKQQNIFQVIDAPIFNRPIFTSYAREPHNPELIAQAIQALNSCFLQEVQ